MKVIHFIPLGLMMDAILVFIMGAPLWYVMTANLVLFGVALIPMKPKEGES